MEYNTTLNINDRLFFDIEEYCRVNGLDMKDYMVELIEMQHMVNKYGDLNDKIVKVVENTKVEVKKCGRPKKKKTEDVAALKNIDTEKEVTIEDEIPNTKPREYYINMAESERVESIQTNVTEDSSSKPTVRRKRTLKTL